MTVSQERIDEILQLLGRAAVMVAELAQPDRFIIPSTVRREGAKSDKGDGETLDDLLLASGRTFGAVAKKAGITRATIRRMRLGRNPHPGSVAAVAVALGVEPSRVRRAIARQVLEAQA